MALGAAAYLVTLAATLPADVALPATPFAARFSGTLWHGEALLAGGNRIGWDWAPLRSFAALSFAADWHATGAGTDLGGKALLRAGSLRMDDISGNADGGFVAALAPDLPFACDTRFSVTLPRFATGDDAPLSTGEILSEAGTCRSKAGGPATSVAPLAITTRQARGGSRIIIAPQGQRRLRLAEAILDAGRLDLAITPAGTRELPFLAPPGVLAISFEL